MARRKPEAHNYLDEVLDTKIVNNACLAQTLGELLIANHYGSAHMEAQQPFSVTEGPGRWIVTGSRNQSGENEGLGAARIVIQKRDGKILEMHIPYILHPHPEVKPILKKVRKTNS